VAVLKVNNIINILRNMTHILHNMTHILPEKSSRNHYVIVAVTHMAEVSKVKQITNI